MIFQRSCRDIIIKIWCMTFALCCAKYRKWKQSPRSNSGGSEIEEIRQKLPKLGPLTKALQIHEIMITSDGQVRSKNLPSDVFYENVKVKESRRIRRVDHDDDIWYTRPHDRSCIAVLKSINFILIPWIDLFGQYHVGTWQNIKFLVSKNAANNLIYFKW